MPYSFLGEYGDFLGPKYRFRLAPNSWVGLQKILSRFQWFLECSGSQAYSAASSFDQPSENSILETHGAIPKTPETMSSLTLLTPFCVRTKIAPCWGSCGWSWAAAVVLEEQRSGQGLSCRLLYQLPAVCPGSSLCVWTEACPSSKW